MVSPGRDEGRREAILGGEMSQCVSVSSDLTLNIAWCLFPCPLCCVSFSQREGESGDQAKLQEGCFSIFSWCMCCQN